MKHIVNNEEDMKAFGESLGCLLCGGEIIELIGDVGAGKTTFVKGIATGLCVDESVQSPSFTISRVYQCRDNLILNHYDFYRLDDAGIMANEIKESISDPDTITIIEWSGLIVEALPKDRLTVKISVISEKIRELDITAGGENSKKLEEKITA